MSQTKLVFRGLNSDECRTFIREVHQRAHELDRFKDNTWMAHTAMAALDGDALSLFKELEPETQDNWTLLREELLRRYCSDERTFVPQTTVTTAATDPLVKGVPPISDILRMRIKVVAPKANYVGYVSGFDYTEYGRTCTLTRDRTKALQLAPDSSPLFEIFMGPDVASGHWQDRSWIKPFRTRQGALAGAALALWVPVKDQQGSYSHHSPTEDGKKVDGSKWNWLSWDWRWTIDQSGKLVPNPSSIAGGWPAGMRATLSKTSNGTMTILYWQSFSWETKDDTYVVDLYLERWV